MKKKTQSQARHNPDLASFDRVGLLLGFSNRGENLDFLDLTTDTSLAICETGKNQRKEKDQQREKERQNPILKSEAFRPEKIIDIARIRYQE
jgi:hypothetical protein